MQQTRVEQGLPYYLKFTEKYPVVYDLALASQDEVLKLWQGLGYYSRARNMHNTAKMVVSDFGGRFPESYQNLLKLKGVGEYTAAAIASIAFNEQVAVVDGNVNRVLSRYYSIHEPVDTTKGKKLIKEAMQQLVPKKEPGLFNQAVMELGSLVCKPTNPDCLNCPVAAGCSSQQGGNQLKFPVKSVKKKVSHRYFIYVVPIVQDKTVLRLRNENDIWKGLYEFPLIEIEAEVKSQDDLEKLIAKKLKTNKFNVLKKNEAKHLLTHRVIHAQFVLLKVDDYPLDAESVFVPVKNIKDYPVSRLTENFLLENVESFSGR